MLFKELLALLSLAVFLGGCASGPGGQQSVAPPKADLQFMDLQGFDRDLAGALSAPLPRVEVGFYDHVVPSAIPERMQRWMASVEAGGGSVQVVPPKSTVTSRSPFLLVSAISYLWSASKMVKEYSTQAQFKAAQAFDAEILLKQDAQGETVVDKVVFTQRRK